MFIICEESVLITFAVSLNVIPSLDKLSFTSFIEFPKDILFSGS